MSFVIQIMAVKLSGNADSLIGDKELQFEWSGLWREVGGEDRSLRFGDGNVNKAKFVCWIHIWPKAETIVLQPEKGFIYSGSSRVTR